jgi:hypothetical protein
MRKKFLLYEPYQVSHDDPIIKQCIAETLEGFKGEPERVTIRISLDL